MTKKRKNRKNRKIKRNEEIYQLYKAGNISLASLGRKYGISRQRIHQLIQIQEELKYKNIYNI